MRGGKREGAGRKSGAITKIYRLPIELEPQIIELVNKHKNKALNSVTKSIDPVKPKYPVLSKDELKQFRNWLITLGFARSPTEARKMTDTPKLCQETFIKFIHLANEEDLGGVNDLMNKYIVE